MKSKDGRSRKGFRRLSRNEQHYIAGRAALKSPDFYHVLDFAGLCLGHLHRSHSFTVSVEYTIEEGDSVFHAMTGRGRNEFDD